MVHHSPIIVWFRNDLRIHDNPALYHASLNGNPIIPLFILDKDAMDRDYGAAQKLWLHYALNSLREEFKKFDLDLIVRQGNTLEILDSIIKETNAVGVYWNRHYERWQIERDDNIKSSLLRREIDAHSFKANLLFEPWEIESGSGSPYKVFTPYYKKCMYHMDNLPPPLPKLGVIKTVEHKLDIGNISTLKLLPNIKWDKKIKDNWDISEDGAWLKLNSFLKKCLDNYKDGRNIPSVDKTSQMSPYLRWGMISPLSIWHETTLYSQANDVPEAQYKSYLREIIWREFTHHLLYYNPDMKDKPIQSKFTDFPWDYNRSYLEAWQSGCTGYPIVDAGMRQLWQTGWMHNRVRMIVGSFLVKHLLQPWQSGEKWFWDTLVDADPANNTAGWQWIGGCGADAAPYFRIFNPMTQGEKFDAYAYVRKYVPEISDLSDKFLMRPWEAEKDLLSRNKIILGETYPKPIISHKEGREKALAAFEAIKN